MSAATLEAIKARRLALLRSPGLLPEPSEEIAPASDGEPISIKQELPRPPTEADVEHVTSLYNDSAKYVTPARAKLASKTVCVIMTSPTPHANTLPQNKRSGLGSSTFPSLSLMDCQFRVQLHLLSNFI